MNTCTNCKLKYSVLTDELYKLCEFCNIIKNNHKLNIFNFVICHTKLTQLEIIQKTYDYYINNDKIPTPNQIDINCKIIKVNPYLFRENIKSDKYKIFFTNCISKNKLRKKKIGNEYPIEKIDINKFCNGIELENFDKDIYIEYCSKIGIV